MLNKSNFYNSFELLILIKTKMNIDLFRFSAV